MQRRFVVITPEQQRRSGRSASSPSRANQHKAKYDLAKSRARRRAILLKAAEYPDGTTIDSVAQPPLETNAARPSHELMEDSKAHRYNKSTLVRHQSVHKSRDEIHHNLVEYCPLQYYTEPVFFGTLPWLSGREMDDLTQYLQIIPSLVMGPTRSNKHQPLRDLFTYYIHASPGVIDWLLVEAEGIRSLSDPSIRPIMQARRTRIYRKMNKMLADPTARCSTELLSMIIAAACIEYQTGAGVGVSAVRIHCKGLYNLIKGRGGLASLFGVGSSWSHPILSLVWFQLGELEVSSRQEAHQCCETFLETLQDIQMSVISRGCALSLSRCVGDVADKGDPARLNEVPVVTDNSYANLKYIVHRKRQDDSVSERISQFLTLYLIALVISDFGTNDVLVHKFLSRLSVLVEDRINSITGATRLQTHVLLWSVGTAWVDVDASSLWPGSGPHKEIWITQAAIDALEVFSRLPDARKDDLTNLLTDWLCSGCGDDMHEFSTTYDYVKQPLRPNFLFGIFTECCSDWYEQHVALEQRATCRGKDVH